jgi:hypothetical protein
VKRNTGNNWPKTDNDTGAVERSTVLKFVLHIFTGDINKSTGGITQRMI